MPHPVPSATSANLRATESALPRKSSDSASMAAERRLPGIASLLFPIVGTSRTSQPGVLPQKDSVGYSTGQRSQEHKRSYSLSDSDSESDARAEHAPSPPGAASYNTQPTVVQGQNMRVLHPFIQLAASSEQATETAAMPTAESLAGTKDGTHRCAEDAEDENDHAQPARRGRRSLPRTGLRHTCTVPGCEWSFKRFEHLKRHMMTHSGERPFICSHPGCNKSFGRSDNFAAHVRTHDINRRKSSASTLDAGFHKRPAAEESEELKRSKLDGGVSTPDSVFSSVSDHGSCPESPGALSPTSKGCSIQMMLNTTAVSAERRASPSQDSRPGPTNLSHQSSERGDEEKNSAAILLASMRTSTSSTVRPSSSSHNHRGSYQGTQFAFSAMPSQGTAQQVFVLPQPPTQFQFQHPQGGMVLAGGGLPPGSFVLPFAQVRQQPQAPLLDSSAAQANARQRSRALSTMPNLLVLPAQLAPRPQYAVAALPTGPMPDAEVTETADGTATASSSRASRSVGRRKSNVVSGASGTEGDEADGPGSKPHRCHYAGCGRRFKRREHLRRHLRTHTDEKPFECPVCHKNFSRNDNLTQHIRIHKGVRSQQRRRQPQNVGGNATSLAALAAAVTAPASPGSHNSNFTPAFSVASSPTLDGNAGPSSVLGNRSQKVEKVN